MTSWKENKLVGIVAGVVFLIAMGSLAAWFLRKPTPPPGALEHAPAIPSTTPFVGKPSNGGEKP